MNVYNKSETNLIKTLFFFRPNHEFKIFSTEYQTLFHVGRAGHLDEDVIDAVAAIHKKNWADTIFVATSLAINILVEMSDDEKRPHPSWFMYHLESNFKGRIFKPYVHQMHWCLYIVDVDRETTAHVDPFSTDSAQNSRRAQMCNQNFFRYLEISREYIRNSLNSVGNWKQTDLTSRRPLQHPSDYENCGLYITLYIRRVRKKNTK